MQYRKGWTAWGCPCQLVLDDAGEFIKATDGFGKRLSKGDIKLYPKNSKATVSAPEQELEHERIA